jgi:hypothetical protein
LGVHLAQRRRARRSRNVLVLLIKKSAARSFLLPDRARGATDFLR